MIINDSIRWFFVPDNVDKCMIYYYEKYINPRKKPFKTCSGFFFGTLVNCLFKLVLQTVTGCEERSPEPKPRWNPKPEQIRILEAIFNSGMVNPPRDEIRKIRAQLQEYGQVGDANVFYWFQNRKSRSKHKLRHLQNSQQQNPPITTSAATQTRPTSSSSSSDKSSPKASKRTLSLTSPSVIDVSNSPTGSVNQTYFQSQNDFMPEPLFFPVQHTGGGGGTGAFTQGFCFSELSNVVHVQDHMVGPCTSLLLNEMMNSGSSKKGHHEEKNMSYTVTSPFTHSIGLAPLPPSTTSTSSVTVPSTVNQIQGNNFDALFERA